MPPRGFPPFSQSPSPPEDGLILWQLTGYCRSLLAVSILIELSPSFSTHKGHLLTIIAFSYRSRAQENCQQMSKTNLSINERTRHGKLLWLTINGQVFGKHTHTHPKICTYSRNLSKKFAKIMKHGPGANGNGFLSIQGKMQIANRRDKQNPQTNQVGIQRAHTHTLATNENRNGHT